MPLSRPPAVPPPSRLGDVLRRVLGLLLLFSALAVGLMRAPDREVETLVARWAPAPSDFIDVGGQVVHLRDEGPRDDPAPLLLLHGTSASLHTWEGWVSALRPQRRVITLDLPGFGLTGPNASGDYRGDTYARFVLATMDQLGVSRFVVGGNSLGGEVAWRTASLAPQRVAGLILVDASGYDFQPEAVPLGFMIARLPVLRRLAEWFLSRSLVRATLASVYGDPSRISDELVERYYELALREGNRRALGQRLQQLEMGEAATRIPALRVPTLVLWGGRDRLIPPVWGERFAREIPGATLVKFDTLGHVPHEEDPATTVAPVRRFLAESATR
jgi:pimeloyl-ACP methyl ester carboxylesterase